MFPEIHVTHGARNVDNFGFKNGFFALVLHGMVLTSSHVDLFLRKRFAICGLFLIDSYPNEADLVGRKKKAKRNLKAVFCTLIFWDAAMGGVKVQIWVDPGKERKRAI